MSHRQARLFSEGDRLFRAHRVLLESVVQPPYVGARLEFDCSPLARFLGLEVNGRHVSFTENVFYRYQDTRIARVWSVIDKAAIERQLQDP